MVYIVRSWKESLLYVVPPQAKLFALVTLQSIGRTYRILFSQFWWLLLLNGVSNGVSHFWFPGSFIGSSIALLIEFTTIFCIYLIVRPSVSPKRYPYYLHYAKPFLVYLIISALAHMIPIILIIGSTHAAQCTLWVHRICYLLAFPFLIIPLLIALLVAPSLVPTHISPLLSFVILCMLDSDQSIKQMVLSIVRGITMTFYNYPFCFILFVFFIVITTGGYYLLLAVGGTPAVAVASALTPLFVPIPLCILANFYTKRLYDQFFLYFPPVSREQ